jgi:short-subunit dehydrogenase
LPAESDQAYRLYKILKKAIIIGATSGIGRDLAKVMSENKVTVGLTGRRVDKLESLQTELPGNSFIMQMDVAREMEAVNALNTLIERMEGVDTIVINAGVGGANPDYTLGNELYLIDINVRGFVAMANASIHYFSELGHGHVVGISSVASLLPNPRNSAYNASKAFISNYMTGLNMKMRKWGKNILISDIRPGFVYTPLTSGNDNMFWVSDSMTASRQIYSAILKRKRVAYITKRWRLIAWFLKIIPDSLFVKAG